MPTEIKITDKINIKTRKLAAAIDVAVNSASVAHAICVAYIAAVHAKEFKVTKDNVIVILEAERAAIAKKAGKAAEVSEIAGSRISERRRILDLSNWACCDAFFAMIADWSLSMSNISDLALWLRKHAKGKGKGWPTDAKKPPAEADVLKALAAARKARNSGASGTQTAKQLAAAGKKADAVKYAASALSLVSKVHKMFGPQDAKGAEHLTSALRGLNAFAARAIVIMAERKSEETEEEAE